MTKVSRRRFLRVGGSAAALAVAGVGYGYADTNSVARSTFEADVRGWTADGFKVAFLTDTHLTDAAACRRAQSSLEWLLGENPDLLIFGGDFVDAGDEDSVKWMAKGLAPVRHARIPCCAVLGNHDYAIRRPERVRTEAERAGFRVMNNDVMKVGPVTFVGLDCMSFGRGRPYVANRQAPEENVLVAVHEPDTADQIRRTSGSVMVAGHSHGGQICLPGGAPLRTPPMGHKYVSGWYPDAPIPVYVSRGVGVTQLPFRLFCRAEAVLMTVKGKRG